MSCFLWGRELCIITDNSFVNPGDLQSNFNCFHLGASDRNI
ncbi:MAG: hypothetical protein WA902_12175 [Thermosynechococcaceae cyanobacterium]